MDSLPALDSPIAVRGTLERVISEAYLGQLPSRTAAILGPLLNAVLRVPNSSEMWSITARSDKSSGSSRRGKHTAPSPPSARDTEDSSWVDEFGQHWK